MFGASSKNRPRVREGTAKNLHFGWGARLKVFVPAGFFFVPAFLRVRGAKAKMSGFALRSRTQPVN